MSPLPGRAPRGLLLGAGLVSASLLLLQVTITRLLSLTQWHHFGFLAVSCALLGLGASGTLLGIRRSPAPVAPRRLSVVAAGAALSMVALVPLLNAIPLDIYLLALDPRQSLFLALTYCALALPFLLGGWVLGGTIVGRAEQAGALYAAQLVGAAGGSPLALLMLPILGEGGAATGGALLALAGAAVLAEAPTRRAGALLGAAGTGLFLVLHHPLGGPFTPRLSPYKGLAQALRHRGASVAQTLRTASARIDVVASDAIHSAPGLSLAFDGLLPRQWGLALDGDRLNGILLGPGTMPDLSFCEALPDYLPFALAPRRSACVIRPGGGLGTLVALRGGVGSVVAVPETPATIPLLQRQWALLSPLTSRAHLRCEPMGPRPFVARSAERFDVVLLSLTDPYGPVTAGAFSLSEEYCTTVEALSSFLSLRAPGGALVWTRWNQAPPSEEIRAAATLLMALERRGVADPARSLLVFRSWATTTFCALDHPTTVAEISAFRHFLARWRFDPVHYPGMRPEEANVHNIVARPLLAEVFPRLLDTVGRTQFLASYPYDAAPPTDARPYFFHFFRWRQLPEAIASWGRQWLPFAGGGYLLLLALLAVTLVVGGACLILPLALRRGEPAPPLFPLLLFAALGVAYISVEVPLLSLLALPLRTPARAFAGATATLLLSSGLGSGLSGSLPPRLSARAPWGCALLAGLSAVLLPPYLTFTLSLPPAIQAPAALAPLVPLGCLMGIPFPTALSRLGSARPGLIPWAWAVNGFASVAAAVGAALIALAAGFPGPLLLGAAAYAAAGGLWGRALREK